MNMPLATILVIVGLALLFFDKEHQDIGCLLFIVGALFGGCTALGF